MLYFRKLCMLPIFVIYAIFSTKYPIIPYRIPISIFNANTLYS